MSLFSYGTLTYGGVYGAGGPGPGPVLSTRVSIREQPPSRISLVTETPAGRHTRWGEDSPRAEDVLLDYRHSSSARGGFKEQSCRLARKPGRSFPDLEPFSMMRGYLPGGELVSETRLERTPENSGDQVSIEPGAVGLQVELEDRKNARFLGIDRDLAKWRGPAGQRRLDIHFANQPATDVTTIVSGILPTLELKLDFPQAAPFMPMAEGIYEAPDGIGSVDFTWTVTVSGGQYVLRLGSATDEVGTGFAAPLNLAAALTGSGTLAPPAGHRFLFLDWWYNSTPAGVDGQSEIAHFYNVAVWGNQGLTKRGPAGRQGLYASDILPALLREFTNLNFTEGADGTIKPSSFVLEQFAFLEPTTALEMVNQALRVHTAPWAVWEDKTFYWPSVGREWRARVAPSGLTGTGFSADKLFNRVIVQYQDVDGSTKTVGWPGSGATTESALLIETDEEAPNYGVERYDVVPLGISTPAIATEVGVRRLDEIKLVDLSGQATLTGFVEDSRGIVHSVAKVRGGDTIVFTDAADTTPRRITEASYSHADRTCSIDLGAPPESLAATVQRLEAAQAGLGV